MMSNPVWNRLTEWSERELRTEVRGTCRPSTSTLAALLAASVAAGCGGGPTEAKTPETNTPHTVEITNTVQLDDRIPTVTAISVQYVDQDTLPGNQPTTIELELDGSLVETMNVSGRTRIETFTTDALPEGTYTARARVCDASGTCIEDAQTFDVRGAHYIATLRATDGRTFFPAANAEFCLDDICAMADANGRVNLENIGTDDRVISVPDGYQENHIAGLGTRRTDRNFFDQTPAWAQAGHIPRDTSITFGENPRAILLFTEDFPYDEIVQRWFLRNRSDPDGLYHPSNQPHRVDYGGGAFRIKTDRFPARVPNTEEEIDRYHQDIQEMATLVSDSVYARIGFTDPKGYEVQLSDNTNYVPEAGVIIFDPNYGRGTSMLKYWDYKQHVEGEARTSGFRMWGDKSRFGHEGLRKEVRSLTFQYFCGLDRSDPVGGGVTAWLRSEEDIVYDPTELEIAACIVAASHGSATWMRVPEEPTNVPAGYEP